MDPGDAPRQKKSIRKPLPLSESGVTGKHGKLYMAKRKLKKMVVRGMFFIRNVAVHFLMVTCYLYFCRSYDKILYVLLFAAAASNSSWLASAAFLHLCW